MIAGWTRPYQATDASGQAQSLSQAEEPLGPAHADGCAGASH